MDTQSSCRDGRSFHFSIPPREAAADFDVVVTFLQESRKREKKMTVCACLLKRSRNKMAQRQDFNFVVLHFIALNLFPDIYAGHFI